MNDVQFDIDFRSLRITARCAGNALELPALWLRERWDQAAFDPDYPTRPLTHFEPLVRRILSRAPFDPAVVNAPV